MARVCNTTCCRCGKKFDRMSGLLVNLSDRTLQEYYNLPFMQEYLKTEGHKHPTLCADCLVELLGRSLTFVDFKFKNNRWMTSNIAFIIAHRDIPQERKNMYIQRLREMDNAGVVDIKLTYEGTKKFSELFWR